MTGSKMPLKEEGSRKLLQYLERIRRERIAFTYEVQDADIRTGNILWVDSGCRLNYLLDGNAKTVIFYTNYRNHHGIQVSCFTGLSFPGQPHLFGYALLQNPSKSAYTWLFKTWMEMMQGQKPKAITTKRDRNMKQAIKELNLRHKICTKGSVFGKWEETLEALVDSHITESTYIQMLLKYYDQAISWYLIPVRPHDIHPADERASWNFDFREADAGHSYLLQLIDRKFKVYFFSPQERNIPDVGKLLRAGSHEQRVCCRALIVNNLPWEVLFSLCCGEVIVVWDVLRRTSMPEKDKKRLQCLLKDVKLVADLSSRDAMESIFPTFDFHFEFLHQLFLSKMKDLIDQPKKMRSTIGNGATVLEQQCPHLWKPSYKREVQHSISKEQHEEGRKIIVRRTLGLPILDESQPGNAMGSLEWIRFMALHAAIDYNMIKSLGF